jgi:hypothetical protein
MSEQLEKVKKFLIETIIKVKEILWKFFLHPIVFWSLSFILVSVVVFAVATFSNAPCDPCHNLAECLVFKLPYPLLCFLLGVIVAAAEISSRYKDEPFLAMFSPPGQYYMLLNGLIALAAFGLLVKYKNSILPNFIGNDPLIRSVVAGFGAMVVMRSKLLNLVSENGESQAVGPDAVFMQLLRSMDRQIDRYRSTRRQEIVYTESMNVKDPDTATPFLSVFLNAFQNLSNAEKQAITQTSEQLKKTDLPKDLKLMAICFSYLNVIGEKNFYDIMKQLGKYQNPQTQTPPPITSPPSTPPINPTPIMSPPSAPPHITSMPVTSPPMSPPITSPPSTHPPITSPPITPPPTMSPPSASPESTKK